MPLRTPFKATKFPIERLGVGMVELELRQAVIEDFDVWDHTWRPVLGGQYSEDWPWKIEIAAGIQQHGRLALAIVGVSSLEAVMSLSVRAARLSGLELIYIEYVQAAPWNEKAADAQRCFKGLGALLIGVAVRLSQEEGLQGRLGLHSKPEVEGFYERLQLRSYGPEPQEDDFVYFEGDEQWAEEFLRRGGA